MRLPDLNRLVVVSFGLWAVLFAACGGGTPQDHPIATITVSPATSTLVVGQTETLTATAYDQDGAVVSGTTFAWSSSANAVATVDSGGMVSGIGQGQATITASSAGVNGTALVTVTPQGQQFELRITYGGDGSGTVTSSPSGLNCTDDCSALFDDGTQVTLAAAPDQGSSFFGYSGDCTGNGCTLTMNQAHDVTVVFTANTNQFPLLVTRNGDGTVTSNPGGIACGADCSEMYDAGTSVTLHAAPDANWNFVGWGGDCTGTGDCALSMTAARTVAATFEPAGTRRTLTVAVTGAGVISSMPPGISCGGGQNSCSATFDDGTQVTLTAVADNGNSFSGWSGACTGSGTCQVTMNTDLSVEAVFVSLATQYQLTVSVSGDGNVSSVPSGINCGGIGSACSASFDAGTQVVLAASPGSGQRFVGWSGACSGSNSCSVTMNSNLSVGATFEPLTSNHQLSVSVTGDGTVSSSPAGIDCGSTCSAAFTSGTVVDLSAVPGTGQRFVAWGGACSGADACQVTMSSDQWVTATFEPIPVYYTVTVTITGSGSVTSWPAGIDCGATCNADFAQGDTVYLNTSPDDEYRFVQWTGDCTGSAGCTLTMDGPKSVGVEFALVQHSLTLSVSGGGSINATPPDSDCSDYCTLNYDSGTPVNLTAIPDPGWLLGTWSGACTGAGPCNLTMTSNQWVEAAFSGPFAFAVSTGLQTTCAFTMIRGETRTLPVQVTLTAGAPLPVDLSISGLPTGVTAEFDPPTVTPDGSATLTLTTNLSVPLGSAPITITGQSGIAVGTAGFALEVRSAYGLTGPIGVIMEDGGATALVTENQWSCGRLVRVDVASRAVRKTIASDFTGGSSLALEAGGQTVLLAHSTGLSRVNLATGSITPIAALKSPYGVALESSGTTALVTDCGASDCATTGRLARVDLASGTATSITQIGLRIPQGVAIEPSGLSALVAEGANERLLRINLASGSAAALASGLQDIHGVSIEAGGATALVTTMTSLMRVRLSSGTKTNLATVNSGCCPGSGDIAIEPGGEIALFTIRSFGSIGGLIRASIRTPVETLAPSRQSVESLFNPYGVVMEPGGATALLTDCGPSACTVSGRVVRVDLETGTVDLVTPVGLNTPRGLTIESATTALVSEDKRLLRVDLATGAASVLSTGFNYTPMGAAVVSAPSTAWITDGWQLDRVDRSTGAWVPFISFPYVCCPSLYNLAIEAGETSALIGVATIRSNYGGIVRANLSSGSPTELALGLCNPVGVALEAEGTALVTQNCSRGRVLRVDPITGAFTVLSSMMNAPTSLALEPGGTSALIAEGNRLLRFDLTKTVDLEAVAQAVELPTGVALEAGDATALFLDCGPSPTPNCTTSARLRRVNLASKASVTLSSAFNQPSALAIEASGTTALVTDCGPIGTNDCANNGRLLRINLANGSKTQLVTGLNRPDGIHILPGGSNALVAERGTGRILDVDLAAGSFVPAASGLSNPHQATLEASESTFLVADDYGLSRVDRSSGSTTYVMNWYTNIERFAIEPGGETALIVGSPSGSEGNTLTRINLTTGGLDFLVPGLLLDPHTVVVDQTGTFVVLTESRWGTGAVLMMAVP